MYIFINLKQNCNQINACLSQKNGNKLKYYATIHVDTQLLFANWPYIYQNKTKISCNSSDNWCLFVLIIHVKSLKYDINIVKYLVITRSKDLRKKTCISSLCSCDIASLSKFFDLQLPPVALNIYFCFSNHQGTVSFFLTFSLLSSFLQYHHEEGNFFLEYAHATGFLSGILFGSVLFSYIRSITTSYFIFSNFLNTTWRISLNTSSPI